MRRKLIFLSFFICIHSHAREYQYQASAGDQLGSVLLSLGHLKIWSEKIVNSFESKSNTGLNIHEGTIIRLKEEDIIFKKNVYEEDGYLKIRRKAFTQKDYFELQALETSIQETETSIEIVPETNASPVANISSFKAIIGAGGFISDTDEKVDEVATSTFSGLQPEGLIGLEYFNQKIGLAGLELLVGKISNDKYSFPLNTDLKFQFSPVWNFTEKFNFLLTYSMITKSFVGKYSDNEIKAKLESKFFGLGIIVPINQLQVGLLYEKAYTGKVTSSELNSNAKKGYRLEAKVKYEWSEGWGIRSSANYYKLNEGSSKYTLNLKEYKLMMTKAFQF